ncbi:MAG: hypothetical protein GY944_04525, partial [bacterium]|nr:hypothetical protein [bacterium]
QHININNAIIKRWSVSGLRSVKEAAWVVVERTREGLKAAAELERKKEKTDAR